MQQRKLNKFLFVGITIILGFMVIVAAVFFINRHAIQEQEAAKESLQSFINEARTNNHSGRFIVTIPWGKKCWEEIKAISGNYTIKFSDASPGSFTFMVEFDSGQVYFLTLYEPNRGNGWTISCGKPKANRQDDQTKK